MNALSFDEVRTLDAIEGLHLAGLHRVNAHTQGETWSAAWPIKIAVLNGVEAE